MGGGGGGGMERKNILIHSKKRLYNYPEEITHRWQAISCDQVEAELWLVMVG